MNLHNDRATRNKYKRIWGEFIRELGPFEWFMTLTFKNPDIKIDEARKRFNCFVRRINEDLFGRRYREKKKGVFYASVIEYQKVRHAIHFHCVMGGGVDKLNKNVYRELWFRFKSKPCKAGKRVPTLYKNGIAKIDYFDPDLNGISYILKQIDWGDEIDIYSPNVGRQATRIQTSR